MWTGRCFYSYRKILFIFFLLITCFASIGQSGVLDLRDTSLEEDMVLLQKSWQFHVHHFLKPDQTDTAHWENVDLPQRWDRMSWKDNKIPQFGIMTYKLVVLLPNDHPPLGIKLYESLSAHKLFVNGELLDENGKISKQKESEQPSYNNQIIPIPKKLSSKDTLQIILHVSNWNYVYGGIKSNVYLGDLKYLEENKEKKIAVSGLLLGAIFLLGISQFILFAFRRESYYYLCLTLVSFTLFLRLASVDEMIIKILLPNLNHHTLLDIRWITTYLALPATLLFIYTFYTKYTKKWILVFSWVFAMIHVIAVFIVPYTSKIYLAYHFHIFMVLGAIYIVYVCVVAARKKELGARTLIVGLLITIPLMVVDILYAQLLSPIGNVIGWGIIFFFLALFTVTAKRFSLALRNEEKLTAELSNVNKNLEEIVEVRTRHIEEKNVLIEEQKEVLQNQHDSLKLLLKDQETLMAMIAHDLKAPLNRAAGLAEVLSLSGELSDDQLALNKKIIEVAHSGSKLIEQLTMLQKYEQSEDNLKMEKCEIDKLLSDQLEGYEKSATDKKIKLISNLNGPIVFKTNKDALSRILDNLISNAIKFSPPYGTIKIDTSLSEKELVIKITDEGPGFTHEDKEKLFGKFQRLSAQPTGGESSTGLGLSIIKILVDKLEGKIKLKSKPGQGATFILHFPIK